MALRAFSSSKRAGTFCRGLQSRAFSTDGRILDEEERAAENLYIKKMEKEKLEKARQKAKQSESEVGGSAEPGSSSTLEPSKESSKKFTIVAGVAAVLGIGWWLSSSDSKKHKDKN